MTGWFGKEQSAVAELATLAGAISTGPLCLAFQETDGWRRGPNNIQTERRPRWEGSGGGARPSIRSLGFVGQLRLGHGGN